jgi:molybdopterin/thiamine biosynthesis adenylyltransferase
LIDTVPKKLSEAEIFELTDRASVVVDCTDNFETRHLVNRACVLSRTPLVSAAAIRFEGQLMVWDPVVEGSPCYACLYPVDQPVDINCATTGVAAPLVGVMGSLQAMETIKVILGIASEHTGRLTTYDGLHSDWQTFRFKKRADCPACGEC